MGTGSDWRPTAPLESLQQRARILQRIRAFFDERGVMEVETPVLSAAAITDPHLESFSTRYTGPGHAERMPLYLHTSPEFPMKRLLAAGSGAIFQLGKVFRQGEAGRRHNPEFTLLEWYRPGFDHKELMDEVAALVAPLLGLESEAVERLSYREAFLRHAGIDPLTAPLEALQQSARMHGISGFDGESERDVWLDLLLTHCIEPELGREGLCFLYDYPASQAALARLNPDDPRVAERFELYYRGIELANGFHELADSGEQRKRFEAELRGRKEQRLEPVPMDERLLAALDFLPDCAGVALGVDRLVMLALGAESIEEVIAFTIDNC
ncbi:MAG: EF-P lysine aminoacylase EpmA [Pseudomonadota bacterium]